jgi:hypothetical protein
MIGLPELMVLTMRATTSVRLYLVAIACSSHPSERSIAWTSRMIPK